MPEKRPYHPTKAAWAAAKASELREQARSLRYRSSGGSCARAARKGHAVDNLLRQASRYDALAERFRRTGT